MILEAGFKIPLKVLMRGSTSTRSDNKGNYIMKRQIFPFEKMADMKQSAHKDEIVKDAETEVHNLKVEDDDRKVFSCFRCTDCCSPETSPVKVLVSLSTCGFAGLVFGWCMEKSRGKSRITELLQ